MEGTEAGVGKVDVGMPHEIEHGLILPLIFVEYCCAPDERRSNVVGNKYPIENPANYYFHTKSSSSNKYHCGRLERRYAFDVHGYFDGRRIICKRKKWT